MLKCNVLPITLILYRLKVTKNLLKNVNTKKFLTNEWDGLTIRV